MEALRGLAALGVVSSHTLLLFGSYRPDDPFHQLVYTGSLGVFLFFALSGYLLFRPFARMHFFGQGRIRLRPYMLNRALRILPLYFVVIGVFLVLIATTSEREHWWRYMLLIQEFFRDSANTLDGPAWSLTVELQFYLLLPLLAAVVAVIARRKRRLAISALVALAILSLGFRQYTQWIHPTTYAVVWFHSFPGNFAFFVPGMILALWEPKEATDERPRRLRALLATRNAWAILAILAWLAIPLLPRGGGGLPRDVTAVIVDTMVLIAAYLALGACVLTLRDGRLVRLLEWRPLVLVGVASYSLYLWHYPIVQRLPRLTLLGHQVWVAQWVFVVAICCTIAAISYAVIEAPGLRLRRRWSSGQKPVASVSTGLPESA